MTKKLRELIAQQKAAQAKYNEDLRNLTENTKYNEEYLNTLKADLASKYATDKAARGKQAADALLKYKGEVRGKLDLNDPVLTKLIDLTTAMGPNTPMSIIDSAVEHYRGNNATLTAIKDIIKNNGIEYAAIDRFIIDEAAIDEAIIEARKDFDRNNGLSPIGLVASHIEAVEAAQIAPEPIAPSNIPLIF